MPLCKPQTQSCVITRCPQFLTQPTVARDAPGCRDTVNAQAPGCADGLCDEHLDDRRLHARAEVTDRLLIAQDIRMSLEEITHRSFQTRETKIIAGVAQQWTWKIESGRVPFGGKPIE